MQQWQGFEQARSHAEMRGYASVLRAMIDRLLLVAMNHGLIHTH